jgi:osomolarity two-component system response regulator SSK1
MDLKNSAFFRTARQKLWRRGSHASTSARSNVSAGSDTRIPSSNLRSSVSMTKLPAVSSQSLPDEPEPDQRLSKSAVLPQPTGGLFDNRAEETGARSLTSRNRPSQDTTITTSAPTTRSSPVEVRIQEPTPISPPFDPSALTQQVAPLDAVEPASESEDPSQLPAASARSTSSKPTAPGVIRRQSLVTTSNAGIIKSLLHSDIPPAALATGPPTQDYFAGAPPTFNAGMLHRKIWVKRPNASATLVQIREDDLVDDVRDMILKKYANSLGKNFDAPDVTLRIRPRDSTSKAADRTLGPEEEMCRTLDAYYPGGQTVNDALLIEVPQRRTPKPSPRIPLYYAHHDDSRPTEASSEYFPTMPPIAHPSPAAVHHEVRPLAQGHSISVLSTGQLPLLPSPGGTRRGHLGGRPKYPRHNTASPTALTGAAPNPVVSRPSQRPRHDSSASESKHSATASHPIPTPPAPEPLVARQNSTPPTPRVASPRPDKKKKKKKEVDAPSLPAGLLDGSVPPINVLIVEDNMINLRVLGAFMQRLKVRWQKAMNGKEAVEKWREGGFHLVLMDIQLPIMNGLEATKEIRRLERVNSIGVFSSGSNEAPNNRLGDVPSQGSDADENERLGDRGLFKSPVIIVALTASSLQSDRHEALAAGCNDFLTKVRYMLHG